MREKNEGAQLIGVEVLITVQRVDHHMQKSLKMLIMVQRMDHYKHFGKTPDQIFGLAGY